MEFSEYKDYSRSKDYLEFQNVMPINKNFTGNVSSDKSKNFKNFNAKDKKCDSGFVKQTRQNLTFSNVDTSTSIAHNKKCIHEKEKNMIKLNQKSSSNGNSNELSSCEKTSEFVSNEEKIESVSDKNSVECSTGEDICERYSHSKSNQLHSTQNSGRSQITFRDPEFFDTSVAELQCFAPENKHARFENREYGNPYLEDFDSNNVFESSSYEGTSSWVPARPLTGIWDRNKFFSSLFDK